MSEEIVSFLDWKYSLEGKFKPLDVNTYDGEKDEDEPKDIED